MANLSANFLTLAVLSGLMGAPHCLIMCGGIVSSFALNAKGPPLKPIVAYNAGRVLTYSAVGGIMGAAGSFLNMAGRFVGIQGIASMLGGAFILLWTFRKYTLPVYRRTVPGHDAVLGAFARLRQRYELLGVFLTGLLLGLLPCGLTYAMQMNAAASGSWLEGALMLLAFGLATFPVLLLSALTAGRIGRRWRRAMNKAGHGLAVLMGFLSIMKGLSVNGWIASIHPWLW
jgi:hypothetical protein